MAAATPDKTTPLSAQPCAFFQQGQCNRGPKCRFAHVAGDGPVAQPRPQHAQPHAAKSPANGRAAASPAAPSSSSKTARPPPPAGSASSSSSSDDDDDEDTKKTQRARAPAKAAASPRKASAPQPASSSSSSSSSSSDDESAAQPARKKPAAQPRAPSPAPVRHSQAATPLAAASAGGHPGQHAATPMEVNGSASSNKRAATDTSANSAAKKIRAEAAAAVATPTEGVKIVVCRYWLRKGMCTKGAACIMLHPGAVDGAAASPSSQPHQHQHQHQHEHQQQQQPTPTSTTRPAAPPAAATTPLQTPPAAPRPGLLPTPAGTPTANHAADKSKKHQHTATPAPAPAPTPVDVSQLFAHMDGAVAAVTALVARTRSHARFGELYDPVLKQPIDGSWRSTSRVVGQLGGTHADFQLLGLDCEMVQTEGDDAALARVTLVRLGLARHGAVPAARDVVLDLYVRPAQKVVDYRTYITGITAATFASDSCVTFHEAQEAVCELVGKHTILVGHSLQNDFQTLRLRHELFIDTALVFPIDGLTRQMVSLRDLVRHFLDIDCQPHGQPHDSIADAAWPLEVVRSLIDRAEGEGLPAPDESWFTVPLPEAYRLKLNVLYVPEGVTLATVQASLAAYGIPPTSVPPAELSFRSHGQDKPPVGTTTLFFASVNQCKQAFDLLPDDRAKADNDGLWRKRVPVAGATKHQFFWVKCYFPYTPPAQPRVTPQATPSAQPANSQATTPKTKFCTQCGGSLQADSKFCGYCGHRLQA